MPVIEELDEHGNVIDEDGSDEEVTPDPAATEAEAAKKARYAKMEEEEQERVERQFTLGEELRVEGNKLFAEGDLEGAVNTYEAALKELTMIGNRPENRTRGEKANVVLFLNLALIKLKLKQYDDVKFRCSTALLTDPKNVKALYRRGLAHAALAREAALFQEAEAKSGIADFEAALQAEPGNAEAQRELVKLKSELRAHERELAQKQRETWGQVFGGKTVVEGEEDDVPPPPPPTVRPCANSKNHLILTLEGVSVKDQLKDISLDFRQSWCIGLTGGSEGCRAAMVRAIRRQGSLDAGKSVVHEKEPKPGRRKPPPPVDNSILLGGLVVVLGMFIATEVSPVSAGAQRWIVRVMAPLMLWMIHSAWKYSRECRAPLTVSVAVASPAEATALGTNDKVEDVLGGLFARQLSSEERRERVIAILAAAGFQGSSDSKASVKSCIESGVRCGDLSESQRRVVQILTCIVQRPEVIVCNEALAGLPLDNQARILRMLRRLKQECKTSVLFMSSDMDEVSYIADSLGVLSPEGELIEKGPTLEVLETPRHETTQAIMVAVQSLRGGKHVAGPVQAQVKELLGNKALEGPWIPPIYT